MEQPIADLNPLDYIVYNQIEPLPETTVFTPDPIPNPAPGQLDNTREKAIANSTVTLSTIGGAASVVSLTGIINNVSNAILVLEAAAGATPGAILARLWQDGSHPTTGKGLPLKDGSVIEIAGRLNVRNTRIISVDGKAHTLQIQYFN